jgi:hypothetical protein
MSRFFPQTQTLREIRDRLATNPRYDWESALADTMLDEPEPADLDEVVSEFMRLAEELSLSTGDVPFWVMVIPLTEDSVTASAVVALMPDSGELVHGGTHPRCDEVLSQEVREANPSLAANLAGDLSVRLIRCRTSC